VSSDRETAVKVLIRGVVQGVYYRGWTVDEAQTRGLRGWVRNRQDGSVEALFVGRPAAVDAMVEACRQGPPSAKVTEVEQQTVTDDGAAGFRQLPTV
jgi:acylphosphatase